MARVNRHRLEMALALELHVSSCGRDKGFASRYDCGRPPYCSFCTTQCRSGVFRHRHEISVATVRLPFCIRLQICPTDIAWKQETLGDQVDGSLMFLSHSEIFVFIVHSQGLIPCITDSKEVTASEEEHGPGCLSYARRLTERIDGTSPSTMHTQPFSSRVR